MEFDNDVSDSDSDDLDELIGHMQVSMIKERTSIEELELVSKYYDLLNDMLFTDVKYQQNKSYLNKHYLIALRKELLDIFETYKKMFDILLSDLQEPKQEQGMREEYRISLLNKELLENGKFSSDFDFFHNSFLLFGSIKKLIDDYAQFEKDCV